MASTVRRSPRWPGGGRRAADSLGRHREIDDLYAVAALRAEQQLDGLDGVIVGKALYEQRFTVAEALAALVDDRSAATVGGCT